MTHSIGPRLVSSHRPQFIADAGGQPSKAAHHHIDPRHAHRTAGAISRREPRTLGPMLGMPVGYRGDPSPYRPGTPRGDLSACVDAVGIAQAIVRHGSSALTLVTRHAPELLQRIVDNDEFDPETRLAHVQALAKTVGHAGGKVEFVTQSGQYDLRQIVDSFRHTNGVRQDQIARLLIALEGIPKAVRSRQAQAMQRQAQGPGFIAPDFRIFEGLHATNHSSGEQGGKFNGHRMRYEYPHGRTFQIEKFMAKQVPVMNGYYAMRLAAPLLALAAQRSA